MKVISLQSGSNGNCIYVEADGLRLLFDAGISGKQAQLRLAEHNIDINTIDAIIISHEHIDHVKCAGIYHRKFNLPIYITPKTWTAAYKQHNLGAIGTVNHFAPNSTFYLPDRPDVAITAIPTHHDCIDGSCFVIEHNQKRLGLCTDLGHAFPELNTLIPTLDALIIESNFDPDMLHHSAYPIHTQRRIAGPHGHLSNHEAASSLQTHADHANLQWVLLAHLSENNNTPDLAADTHIEHHQLTTHIASRFHASQAFHIE
ncbi:MBL fold metallo-hydrolase [Planctomycetota bacterium]|nr:MBL fold metallo-hydrolase [Planctomycetota bacterium]